jgi:NADH:ubiquinone reductase (H+-translocating)
MARVPAGPADAPGRVNAPGMPDGRAGGDRARPRIVVVGAGFGGLTFCKTFRGDADVLLIDRQNHHLFQPLLYQVAMAGLSAPEIAAPIRGVLARRSRVTTVMAEVAEVDLAARTLRAGRTDWSWDYLVLAPGGVTTWFGREEWMRRAPGLKTLRDALEIRTRILTAFERAETETDERERARLTTIAVVGGGPTGVELAGAMAELAHRVLRRDFRRVDPTRARVLLVEATDRILRAFPPELSERATGQLRELGVDVRLRTRVEEIEGGRIRLLGPAGPEEVETRNVLWAAGVSASPLLGFVRPAVPRDRSGRARVGPDLGIPGFPRAFVIGDAARVDAGGGEVPGLAPAAMQMGRFVARLLEREIRPGGGESDPALRPPSPTGTEGRWPRSGGGGRSRSSGPCG